MNNKLKIEIQYDEYRLLDERSLMEYLANNGFDLYKPFTRIQDNDKKIIIFKQKKE